MKRLLKRERLYLLAMILLIIVMAILMQLFGVGKAE